MIFSLIVLFAGFIFYFGRNDSAEFRQDAGLNHNVEIKLLNRFSGEAVPGNTIGIYFLNPAGSVDKKLVTSGVTDEKGIARFTLSRGVYRAIPAGSWAGSTDFSLSVDTQELKVNLYVNSILN